MNLQAIFLDGAPPIQKGSVNGDPRRLEFLRASLASVKGARKILVSSTDRAQLAEALTLQASDEVKIVNPKAPTRGALASALLPIDLLPDLDPIVLVPTNSITNLEALNSFLTKMYDTKVAAGIMLIDSNNPHFSYARVYQGKVIEIIEKVIVGNLATTGIFYFRDKKVLKECARWAFINNQSTGNSFFIAPSLNYVLSTGEDIGYQIVDSSNYQHLTW
jgi:dTDP-glucose pyrophosphorylase